MDAGKDAEKPGGDRARADLTELAAPDIGVPLNGERLRTPRRPAQNIRWIEHEENQSKPIPRHIVRPQDRWPRGQVRQLTRAQL